MSNQKMDSRQRLMWLVTCGMLIAIDVILSRYLSISIGTVGRLSLSFIAISAAAYLYGPISAMLVHALADIVGTLMASTQGAFAPGFTITAALIGLIYGFFLYRSRSLWRIILGVLGSQLFCSLLLNTYWQKFYYNKPFLFTLSERAWQVGIMIVVQIGVLPAILLALERGVKPLLKR